MVVINLNLDQITPIDSNGINMPDFFIKICVIIINHSNFEENIFELNEGPVQVASQMKMNRCYKI